MIRSRQQSHKLSMKEWQVSIERRFEGTDGRRLADILLDLDQCSLSARGLCKRRLFARVLRKITALPSPPR
jgi:hypothetical protein